jgi:hypothetical protein
MQIAKSIFNCKTQRFCMPLKGGEREFSIVIALESAKLGGYAKRVRKTWREKKCLGNCER